MQFVYSAALKLAEILGNCLTQDTGHSTLIHFESNKVMKSGLCNKKHESIIGVVAMDVTHQWSNYVFDCIHNFFFLLNVARPTHKQNNK